MRPTFFQQKCRVECKTDSQIGSSIRSYSQTREEPLCAHSEKH